MSTTNGTTTTEGTPLLSTPAKQAKTFLSDVSASATKTFGDVSASATKTLGEFNATASKTIGDFKATADTSIADISAKTREVFSEENVGKVKQVASVQFNVFKESAVTGNISIRYCALFAGFVLLVTALIGFGQDLFAAAPAPALVELYAMLLGCLMLILETKGNTLMGYYQIPTTWINELHTYALFLKYVWGRGCLYAVAGSLQMAQGGRGNVMVGCLVLLVGLLYIYSGYSAAQKYLALGATNAVSEAELDAKFAAMEVTELNCDQFWDLVVALGLDWKRPEVETAFLHMDKNQSDTVSLDEVKAWFRTASANGNGTSMDV